MRSLGPGERPGPPAGPAHCDSRAGPQTQQGARPGQQQSLSSDRHGSFLDSGMAWSGQAARCFPDLLGYRLLLWSGLNRRCHSIFSVSPLPAYNRDLLPCLPCLPQASRMLPGSRACLPTGKALAERSVSAFDEPVRACEGRWVVCLPAGGLSRCWLAVSQICVSADQPLARDGSDRATVLVKSARRGPG